MKSPAGMIATVVILNACIWGLTIVLCSSALSGTGAYEKIQTILGGSAAASIIVVGGALAAIRRKTGQGS